MALIAKQNYVQEDIIDENGQKIGEIKFNPNDVKMRQKFKIIVEKLEKQLKKLDSLGDIPNIDKKKLETIEDFESVSEDFQKISSAIDIEVESIGELIDDLSDIFGKETINAFTNGSLDIYSLFPLIDFVTPYLNNADKSRISKYLPKEKVEELEVLE